MTEIAFHLTRALAARYRIERELGAGGMGPRMHTDGSGLTQMIPYE